MKYLFIVLLSLSAHANEPKFYKSQRVIYKTGFFLHKVCSGKGDVEDVTSDANGSFIYTIRPPMSEDDCPFSRIPEKDVKAVE